MAETASVALVMNKKEIQQLTSSGSKLKKRERRPELKPQQPRLQNRRRMTPKKAGGQIKLGIRNSWLTDILHHVSDSTL